MNLPYPPLNLLAACFRSNAQLAKAFLAAYRRPRFCSDADYQRLHEGLLELADVQEQIAAELAALDAAPGVTPNQEAKP